MNHNILDLFKNNDIKNIEKIIKNKSDELNEQLIFEGLSIAIQARNVDLIRLVLNNVTLSLDYHKSLLYQTRTPENQAIKIMLIDTLPSQQAEDFNRIFYAAMEELDFPTMTHLIEHKIDLSQEDWLEIACQKGDGALIDYLTSSPNITQHCSFPEDASRYIIDLFKSGDFATIQTLVQKYGWTIPLDVFYESISNVELFEYVWNQPYIQSEASQLPEAIRECFSHSVRNGHYRVISYQLEHPTIAPWIKPLLSDAIICAAQHGLSSVFEILIKHIEPDTFDVHMHNNLLFQEFWTPTIASLVLPMAQYYVDIRESYPSVDDVLYNYPDELLISIMRYFKRFDPVEFYTHLDMVKEHCRNFHSGHLVDAIMMEDNTYDIIEHNEVGLII